VPDAVDTVVCAPDDGWRYHPKYVEQFPDINKLCNFASFWIYIGIYLGRTEPWTLNGSKTSYSLKFMFIIPNISWLKSGFVLRKSREI
jgi:hypothetical protein